MSQQIILNTETYHITEEELPCLITYGEKAGGSHFSVTMVADLFLRGSKILFLTAYPMAKDNFMEQIVGSESKVSYVTDVNQLDTNAHCIILESGNEALFMEVASVLSDIGERIVLIKNIEVFTNQIFDVCLPMNKIILSGNIDTCVAKEEILAKEYKTIVAFTKPQAQLPIQVPELEKYAGYLWNKNTDGIVKIIPE